MVFSVPLTKPASVYKFDVNIIRAPLASSTCDSRPYVISEFAFLASLPSVCMVRILTTGTFKDLSQSIFIASMSTHFVKINVASENLLHSVLFNLSSNHMVRFFQSAKVDSPSCNLKRSNLKSCCS